MRGATVVVVLARSRPGGFMHRPQQSHTAFNRRSLLALLGGAIVLGLVALGLTLGVTASLGVAYKIVTNLVMLPVAASYVTMKPGWAQRALVKVRRVPGMCGSIAS